MFQSVNFSADGTHIITPYSIDGKVVVVFSINYNTVSYPIWLDENEGVFSYAEFSGDNRGVVAEVHKEMNSSLNRVYAGAHLYKWHGDANSQGIRFFDDLRYSPKARSYTYTLNDRTFLCDARSRNWELENHLLTEVAGSKAFFSINDEYLYSIDGNRINAVFVSAGEIFNVIEKELTR